MGEGGEHQQQVQSDDGVREQVGHGSFLSMKNRYAALKAGFVGRSVIS
jgi:hypothetical protein